MEKHLSVPAAMLLGFAVASATLAAAAGGDAAVAHPPATQSGAGATSPHHPPNGQPVLPAPAVWPGSTVLLILGTFVIAAGVGVAVRLNAPEEVPTAHSHDEPPGTSHHHGPGGTDHHGHQHDAHGGRH